MGAGSSTGGGGIGGFLLLVFLIIVLLVIFLFIIGVFRFGTNTAPDCKESNYASIPKAGTNQNFTCSSRGKELKRAIVGTDPQCPDENLFSNSLCNCNVACKVTESCEGGQKVSTYVKDDDHPNCPPDCVVGPDRDDDVVCSCFTDCKVNITCTGTDSKTTFTRNNDHPNCVDACLTASLLSQGDPACNCENSCGVNESCTGSTKTKVFFSDLAHPNCPTLSCPPIITPNDPGCTCTDLCAFVPTAQCHPTEEGKVVASVSSKPGKVCPAECKINPTLPDPTCHPLRCDGICNFATEKLSFFPADQGRECIAATGCAVPENFPNFPWLEGSQVYLTTVEKGSKNPVLVLGANRMSFEVKFVTRDNPLYHTRWIIDSLTKRIRPLNVSRCLTRRAAGMSIELAVCNTSDTNQTYARDQQFALLSLGNQAVASVITTKSGFLSDKVYSVNDLDQNDPQVFDANTTIRWYTVQAFG